MRLRKNYSEEMDDGEKAIKVLGGKITGIRSIVRILFVTAKDLVHVIILVDKVKTHRRGFREPLVKLRGEPFLG